MVVSRLPFFSVVAFGQLANVVSAANVFAHFMVQNSYSYSQDDWANDIATAQSIGIDGFALNVASPSGYEPDRIENAYAAAEAAGFKLFYSFDMVSVSGAWSSDTIAAQIEKHATSSNTFLWNDTVLVSTYAGQDNGNDFWVAVKSTLSDQGIDISFAPALTSYRDPSLTETMLSTFTRMTFQSPTFFFCRLDDVNETLTVGTDLAYKSAIKESRTAVSPWQFKDISDQNWVEQSDTLWNYRWQQAINDVQPDIVEIVTWNDYAESSAHYIGDINPNVALYDAAAHITGIDHAAWRIVAQYYISYFKTGAAPAITEDQVVFWYRIHPRDTTCSGGTQPRMYDFPADAVFALAMLAEDGTVAVDIGNTSHTECTASGGQLIMGITYFPSEDNQTPAVSLIRNGATVNSTNGQQVITTSCSYYNFNPVVGALSA
ncbi:glycoside hydrolase family 71 protein [Guyanagaster necrorhizus]|uniref:Glycoside hydrolase family 71 protein n=1 Tax=Guyanagaster necrorhizus TaxID=856835 RepID=A0A9P8AQ93_9AGAR|nr:glycoside hydrolase family 71 protein [Guyanagaster necrorhizus MCA 3950]KAG7443601.1 glycoside hydrolase family 71 protein [Guyanagaster necrorhizus MCA 3950]